MLSEVKGSRTETIRLALPGVGDCVTTALTVCFSMILERSCVESRRSDCLGASGSTQRRHEYPAANQEQSMRESYRESIDGAHSSGCGDLQRGDSIRRPLACGSSEQCERILLARNTIRIHGRREKVPVTEYVDIDWLGPVGTCVAMYYVVVMFAMRSHSLAHPTYSRHHRPTAGDQTGPIQVLSLMTPDLITMTSES